MPIRVGQGVLSRQNRPPARKQGIEAWLADGFLCGAFPLPILPGRVTVKVHLECVHAHTGPTLA